MEVLSATRSEILQKSCRFLTTFLIVNGASVYSKKNKAKPLRHAVTEKSINHAFWKDAVKKLQSIKFIDTKGKEITVPSLSNWIVTLKSVQRL